MIICRMSQILPILALQPRVERAFTKTLLDSTSPGKRSNVLSHAAFVLINNHRIKIPSRQFHSILNEK